MITHSRAMADWLRDSKLIEILTIANERPYPIRIWIGETISDMRPPADYHYYFEEPKSFESFVGGEVVPKIKLAAGYVKKEDEETVTKYLRSLQLSAGQASFIVTAVTGGAMPDSGDDSE